MKHWQAPFKKSLGKSMKYKRMHGFIEFDDERVPVLLYLGGDNKVSKHLDYI